VAAREDAAALRVLDGLIGSDTTKNLYARQIADCLLGLFTTYSRHGLKTQAEQVKQRLSTHFPSPSAIGGVARSSEPPMTIRATTRSSPSTLDLTTELDIDLDSRLQSRG
jgi:hypothetical protein